jgi:hypothetical protein
MSAAAALRGALRHAPRAAPRRRMGGLTNVKKNAHVEEWNGRREITEKTFDVGRPRTVATLLATIVAFPVRRAPRRQVGARHLEKQLHQPEDQGHRDRVTVT